MRLCACSTITCFVGAVSLLGKQLPSLVTHTVNKIYIKQQLAFPGLASLPTPADDAQTVQKPFLDLSKYSQNQPNVDVPRHDCGEIVPTAQERAPPSRPPFPGCKKKHSFKQTPPSHQETQKRYKPTVSPRPNSRAGPPLVRLKSKARS